MLRLRDLLEREGDPLQLEALTGEAGLDRQVPDPEVASPGLALAGYVGRFAPQRLHVLGETEITYLNSLGASDRLQRLRDFFSFPLPVVFVTKGLEVAPEMVELARSQGIPLLRSTLKTAEFPSKLDPKVVQFRHDSA